MVSLNTLLVAIWIWPHLSQCLRFIREFLSMLFGTDGFFHEKPISSNFPSVCCDQGINCEGILLLYKLTQILWLKIIHLDYFTVSESQESSQGLPKLQSRCQLGLESCLRHRVLSCSCGCWQNLFPCGCRTHDILLLQGRKEKVSLSLQGRPTGSLKDLTQDNLPSDKSRVNWLGTLITVGKSFHLFPYTVSHGNKIPSYSQCCLHSRRGNHTGYRSLVDQPRILPTWGDIKENMHILLSQELSNCLVRYLRSQLVES